jgi:hypothetical protein
MDNLRKESMKQQTRCGAEPETVQAQANQIEEAESSIPS